jgi:hypothetical protein
MSKSILTTNIITDITSPDTSIPQPRWQVREFNSLIYQNGYDCYIQKAMRCPCVDKGTGQALSTCKNCLGRGWLFVEKRKTKVIAQGMGDSVKYQDWSKTTLGTARITARASDKLNFMDRIIFTGTQLEDYTEILRPILYNNELIAYPIYEPLTISNIYLYVGDSVKLMPLSSDKYTVDGNRIVFDQSIINNIPSNDINQNMPDISISIRYSHYPVYHIIQINRQLMTVRSNDYCSNGGDMRSMPINAIARKAHYIWDAQRFDNELLDNSIKKE